MNSDENREKNQTAYRQLKDTINANYPSGQFVAIDEGRIVGDAGSFPELVAKLESQGRHPPDILIVQAGMNYPEHIVILLVENSA
jgi:hypothetical protein